MVVVFDIPMILFTIYQLVTKTTTRICQYAFQSAD